MILHQINCVVNGSAYQSEAEPRMLLSDFLRHDVGLTGTHVGCEQGACGSCTVLVDGQAVRACLSFAVQADGCEIVTIEGVSLPGDQLSPLQHALSKAHGLQCGFCTPGVIMTATALLHEERQFSREEVVEEMSGSLCRCGGYEAIVDAVYSVLCEHAPGEAEGVP